MSADRDWLKFVVEARSRLVAHRRGESSLRPVIELFELTSAITSEELRTDLINIVLEKGGAPGDFDALIEHFENQLDQRQLVKALQD